MRRFIFFCLLMTHCINGRADDYQSSHEWDHMGTTFAIQIVSYGLVSAVNPKGSRSENVAYSGLVTFLATFTYSFIQAHNARAPLPEHDLFMNLVGQGAAIGSIYAFKF